jgi:putative PEP-CTERM system histidine kinase
LLFRRYGGEWGTILQIASLFGSAVVLATVLSSETARSGIRLAILRNFFTYRYDYRVEWLRCIEALSSDAAPGALPERVIRCVADIVNSPGGVLFNLRDQAYAPVAVWNARLSAQIAEPANSAFIRAFRGGHWVQELQGERAALAIRPAWLESEDFWVAVPLPRQGELLGFVLLIEPRASIHPDWEVFDLLRTVASQAAAYLFQQQAERSLADAQVLQEYSKRFAFVIHDIKNLSSQLGLILSNARRHGDNPDFQADVLHTVENSVSRINKLLSQLRGEGVTSAISEAESVDAVGLVRELVAAHAQSETIDVMCAVPSAPVLIDPDQLRSVLAHLLDNALEAAGADGRVTASLGQKDDRVTIDISDNGPGMELSFVRDELFRPFRSTKDSGLGIGAFQTRELIRAAGGQLDVITHPGAGTTMRITLRAAAPSRVYPAA